MLRINLLPPYIADGQKKKKVIAGWTVGVIAVVVLLIFRLIAANAELSAAKAREDTAKTNQSEYQTVDGQIKKENDKVAKTKEKQDFIANAQKYNSAWPGMLESVRDVTSNQILLKSLTIDAAEHKTINLTGFSQNEMNIVRWWMYLRSHKEKFDTVFFNLPPHGYGGASGVGTGTTGGMGGGMARGPMMGGMFGGMPGGMMPGGMPGGMMRGGMGMQGMGGGGGFGGGRAFGGGAAAGDVGQGILEGKQGINFSAMLVLKDPMNGGVPAPSWPPAAAGGGAMGGVGMGGMMGGMPGGMFGGMGGPGMSGMPGGPAMGGPGGSIPPGAGRSGAAAGSDTGSTSGGGLKLRGGSAKDSGD